ncbi:MAG: hypothetical protein U1E78_11865 [Gammaproteobacteria bacterium]
MIKQIPIFGLPYEDSMGKDSQLVAIPDYPIPVRTAEQLQFDQQHELVWKNHTIVKDDRLGGVHLGEGWLLYIDPDQTVWYLKMGYEVNGNQCAMSCTLESIFGRFDRSFSPINRLLIEGETFLLPYGRLKPLNRFTFERKSDGSEVLIHVYADLLSENTIDLPEEMGLYEIWKLEISGVGYISDDKSLGDGISATLTKFKSYEAIYQNENKTIPLKREEYRVGKLNIKEWYEPEEPIPPNCNAKSFHMTFDLKLVPNNDEVVPFRFDRNTYDQTNWYGSSELKRAIVRMLYDASGEIRTISVKREKNNLKRLYQHFDGKGWATQDNLQYLFKNGVCVHNGNPPILIEDYEGVQLSDIITQLSTYVTLLENDEVTDKMALVGEVAQHARTVIGQPVDTTMNVKVTLNDQVLRDYTDKPGKIPNQILKDPFFGKLPEDKNLQFKTTRIEFTMNNIINIA